MEEFELEVRGRILRNLGNNYVDNYDQLRFGKRKLTIKAWIKSILFKNHTANSFIGAANLKLERFMSEFGTDAATTYALLANDQSRNLYLELICFYILGHRKVKITDTADFLEKRRNIDYEKLDESKLSVNFNSWTLDRISFRFDNVKIQMFSRPNAIFTEFIADQYTYRYDGVNIGIEEGDVCIDAGGCWGDSSLLFAIKTGVTGRVFSFEFIPANLQILEKNMHQNPVIASNIEVIRRPLWSASDVPVWYVDRGPSSKVSFEPLDSADGRVETYTIDQLVEDKNIERVDFIKMDIEGAELSALEGARRSICSFKPKLAICIYHSMEDFTRIAQWIDALNLDYKFFVKHVTIHWEETVLFAISR